MEATMTFLSAAGDTWGISGPQFVLIYLALVGAGFLLAVGLRLSATRSGAKQPGRRPTPAEAALLADGPDRAVYAAVAGLRATGVIGVEGGRLTAAGPLPAGASQLDGAVYEAVRRGIAPKAMGADPLVAAALTEVQASAERAGWLLDPGQTRRARLGAVPLLALVLLGAARIVAGLDNGRPILFISLATVVALVLGLAFLSTAPRVSAAGRAALVELRSHSTHLSPVLTPSWTTYGATGAALGVAIYGTAALWAADPDFAATADVPRDASPAADGASGGDSGGDGGGDGGGGCGGGCGG
jgi:uncharacterized protein (TIGR04222 family)